MVNRWHIAGFANGLGHIRWAGYKYWVLKTHGPFLHWIEPVLAEVSAPLNFFEIIFQKVI